MKLIIKIISIVITILTLSDGLTCQDTANTTTPLNTTNTTTPTNTTNNTTTPTNTTNNTTQPVAPVAPVAPVQVVTDPYMLYLCDLTNSSSISIVIKMLT